MRLYRKDATCPKCSHKKVSALFRAADPIHPHPEEIDRLIRECMYCHFSWPERPMDQATEEERRLLIEHGWAKLEGMAGFFGSETDLAAHIERTAKSLELQREIEAKLWPPIS